MLLSLQKCNCFVFQKSDNFEDQRSEQSRRAEAYRRGSSADSTKLAGSRQLLDLDATELTQLVEDKLSASTGSGSHLHQNYVSQYPRKLPHTYYLWYKIFFQRRQYIKLQFKNVFSQTYSQFQNQEEK